MGIRSSIRAGYNSDDIWQGAIDGIQTGITSVGIEYLSGVFDLDPLVSNAIALTIAGGITGAAGGDILQGIQQAYTNAILNAFSFGLVRQNIYTGEIILSDMTSWQSAAYVSRVLEISNSLNENGLETTLYNYINSVLHYEAIDGFVRPDGVYDILGEELGNFGDMVYNIINKPDGSKEVVNAETGETLARYKEEEGVKTIESGQYEENQQTGEKELVNGRIVQTDGDGETKAFEINNGGVNKVTSIDENDGSYSVVEGIDGGNIEYDDNTGEAISYEAVYTQGNSDNVYVKDVEDGIVITDGATNKGDPDSPESPYKRMEKFKYIEEKLQEAWKDEYRMPPDDGEGQDLPNIEYLIGQFFMQRGLLSAPSMF